MTQNDRTPAWDGEGSGKLSGLAADFFQIAPAPREIQTARILARFAFSAAFAATIANLAYGTGENGRRT